MRKLVSLIILLALTLTAATSCDRSYDEAEVKAAAQTLLEASFVVNEVFYGEGVSYDEYSGIGGGSYYKPVSDTALEWLGISGIEGLKNLARGVYTADLCEIIFRTKLASIKDSSDGSVISYARYIEYYEKQSGKTYLMFYTEDEPNYENEIEYLYETLTVIGADGEYIKIEIDVILTDGNGFTRTDRVEFTILEEKDGFRLDTLSFVKF